MSNSQDFFTKFVSRYRAQSYPGYNRKMFFSEINFKCTIIINILTKTSRNENKKLTRLFLALGEKFGGLREMFQGFA